MTTKDDCVEGYSRQVVVKERKVQECAFINASSSPEESHHPNNSDLYRQVPTWVDNLVCYCPPFSSHELRSRWDEKELFQTQQNGNLRMANAR